MVLSSQHPPRLLRALFPERRRKGAFFKERNKEDPTRGKRLLRAEKRTSPTFSVTPPSQIRAVMAQGGGWRDFAQSLSRGGPFVNRPSVPIHHTARSTPWDGRIITRVASYITLPSNSIFLAKIFLADFFKRYVEVFIMFMKIFILFVLFLYIVFAFDNVCKKDSYLLIERFYKFLKHLYYYLFY